MVEYDEERPRDNTNIQVYIVTTKDIECSAEILGSYGLSYWRSMEHISVLDMERQLYFRDKNQAFRQMFDQRYPTAQPHPVLQFGTQNDCANNAIFLPSLNIFATCTCNIL